MNLDAIAADTLHRHLTARAPWRPDPRDPPAAGCPGCGAPLSLDAAGTDDPDRLVGACPARWCGEVATFRRLEGRLIVAERQRR
jgi:hypothetical protein